MFPDPAHLSSTDMLLSVILASLIFGCISLLSACFNWVRYQRFGIAGAVLSGVGLILIGMAVWASVGFAAPRTESKPSDNTAVQHMIDEGNTRIIAALKDNNKEVIDHLQQFTKQMQADQDNIFSNIQSNILAMRTALSEQPAVTEQHGDTLPPTPKRRAAKKR